MPSRLPASLPHPFSALVAVVAAGASAVAAALAVFVALSGTAALAIAAAATVAPEAAPAQESGETPSRIEARVLSSLPPRSADAPGGKALAASLASLPLEERERTVSNTLLQGNAPSWWRRFVPVRLEAGGRTAVLFVAPDYLVVGSDDDSLRMPLSPTTARAIAEKLGCVLPTRLMVDAIHRAASVKLEPAPMAPSPEMTTVAAFAKHHATIEAQLAADRIPKPAGAHASDATDTTGAPILRPFAPGSLLAGHKKDVVETPRLAAAPGKVAIYGWHRPDGSAIQPLYLGHTDRWVDYSHGIRLVLDAMLLDGRPARVSEVLRDPARCALLSDEGPLPVASASGAPVNKADARPNADATPALSHRLPPQAAVPAKPSRPAMSGEFRPADALPAAAPEERCTEWRPEPDVRVVTVAPATPDPSRAVRLILYALPAGSTIEGAAGRRPRSKDDWRVDNQHIGAQLRWLRAHTTDANLVVAYLQSDQRSWVLWRRAHADHVARAGAIVDGLRARHPGARLTLTGHSAGGSFLFACIDSREAIPDDVDRIAFLDATYAYDAAKGHASKLVRWLESPVAQHRHLAVFAYEDHVALLNGKTFVSAAGGTWGRSHAMLRNLGERFAWTRSDEGALQRHVALGGRVRFLLRANPEKAVWHTRLVELNGLLHALLLGTPHEERDYRYLGPRAYEAFILGESVTSPR